MLSYEKIIGKTWDDYKYFPKCPSKGAFEVLYDNNTYWILNGQLHREDGPAIERANGSKVWYLFGKRHREDGPAIEQANGDKGWYLHGQLHRVDGPAFDWANGAKYWYLFGQQYSKRQWEIEAMKLRIKNAIV